MTEKTTLKPGQWFMAFVLITATFPFSAIYLIFWKNRCVHCGRRITRSKTVCKKCLQNSQAIVDSFDDRMSQFEKAMEQIHDLKDIVNYHASTLKNIEGTQKIYEATGRQLNIDDMMNRVTQSFTTCLDRWLDLNNDPKNKEKMIELFDEILELQEREDVKNILIEYRKKIQA